MWAHHPRSILFFAFLLDWLGQLLILFWILLIPGLFQIPLNGIFQLEDQRFWFIVCLFLYPLLGWLFWELYVTALATSSILSTSGSVY